MKLVRSPQTVGSTLERCDSSWGVDSISWHLQLGGVELDLVGIDLPAGFAIVECAVGWIAVVALSALLTPAVVVGEFLGAMPARAGDSPAIVFRIAVDRRQGCT